MSSTRGWWAAAAASVLLLLATTAPAVAVTGGERDGDRHPHVGFLLSYGEGVRWRCSATLVAPRVLLTAAHCTDGKVGSAAVTFDPVIAEAPPAGLPAAADPTAGYSPGEVAAAGYLSGTHSTHPDYSGLTDLDNWNDVGMILLDEAVLGITPATVAPENYLAAFAQPRLNSTLFTTVGYGAEVRKPDSGPQKPRPMGYPMVRRATTSPGQKLTAQVLQLNGNIHDARGGGGTCSGDSGGPVFLDGYLVAVNSYGFTAHCRYLEGYQRVDIPAVRDWLAV